MASRPWKYGIIFNSHLIVGLYSRYIQCALNATSLSNPRLQLLNATNIIWCEFSEFCAVSGTLVLSLSVCVYVYMGLIDSLSASFPPKVGHDVSTVVKRSVVASQYWGNFWQWNSKVLLPLTPHAPLDTFLSKYHPPFFLTFPFINSFVHLNTIVPSPFYFGNFPTGSSNEFLYVCFVFCVTTTRKP